MLFVDGLKNCANDANHIVVKVVILVVVVVVIVVVVVAVIGRNNCDGGNANASK